MSRQHPAPTQDTVPTGGESPLPACHVVLNGAPAELDPGTTLADVVRSLTGFLDGVAVALDGEVVPRASWDGVRVTDGAVLDVLVAVQGG